MQILLASVVTIITAAAPAQAPQLDLPSGPVNLTFRAATVEEALTVIGRLAGITIEFDATVTEQMRLAPLAVLPLRFNGLIDELLKLVTAENGLTYTVTGPRAIRVTKKV